MLPLKKTLTFGKEDVKILAIGSVAFGIALSWHGWGGVSFELVTGLLNLLLAIVVSGLLLAVYLGSQRLCAAVKGLAIEHRLWWYGPILCVLFVLITNGRFALSLIPITLYALTKFELKIVKHVRWGRRYAHASLSEHAQVALAGPLSVFVVGGFIKTLELLGIVGNWADSFFVFALLIAATNILPIPPLDGAKVFYSTRLGYAFISGTFLGYLFLASLRIYSYILALLIGLSAWLGYYAFFERKLEPPADEEE